MSDGLFKPPAGENSSFASRFLMRRTFLNTLILLVFISFPPACGSELGLGDIGDACGHYSECGGIESRAACINEWPEGYCTELSCTLGSCPLGSRCVTGITFANVSIEAFCLRTCESNADCRDGYNCTDVGQPDKTCTPA